MRSKKLLTGARVSALLLALLLAACSQKPEAMLKSANEFLAKNDAKSAVIQVKNALQVNPDLPKHVCCWARSCWKAETLWAPKPSCARHWT